MTRSRFEWFVAWRHLRDPERRARRAVALKVGLFLVLLALVDLLALKFFGPSPEMNRGFLPMPLPAWVSYLRSAGYGAFGLGLLVSFFGFLTRSFTLFTAISIFGVFLGTAFPILVLSVMSGFEMDLKGKIRGAKADVVITRSDAAPFTDWHQTLAKIQAVTGVRAATPYLESEVVIMSGLTPMAIWLRGIDPTSASSVLDLGRAVRDCQVSDLAHPERIPKDPLSELPEKDAPGIILGEELYARTLRVFQGHLVDVVCPLCKLGPNGPMPGLKKFRVAGHFYSGMYEYDTKLAYIALAEAQQFLSMPGEITGIDARVAAPDSAPAVARAVSAVLGPGFEVRSWEELNKALFMALKIEKIGMFVVMTFIALVASFSIISTLIMMATEKAREIAILKAMGATVRGIQRVFVAEGLYIGMMGLVSGVSTGVLMCLLIQRYGLPLPSDIYYINQLPIVMRTGEILTVAVFALLLCFLATLYPARLASRMHPVDGLRYE